MKTDIFGNREKNKQFYFNYAVFVINGMLALSIGSLLPFIRDANGLAYAFCGMIVSLHSVGNLLSSFAAGALPVFIGRKKSILLFNSFFAVSYLLILFGGNPLTIALAFFMTGLARGATSNFCNASINNLAPGKAWIINGLHAMFSIGAFLFPILLTVLTMNDSGRWICACYFMLAMGILSFSLYLLMPVEEQGKQDAGKKEKNFGFFKEPLFYMSITVLFFYLCAEQGVIGWMITYFKDTGLLSPTLSQITASVLWIMILLGRLTVAWLSTKVKKEKILPVMGVGLLVFFFLLIVSRSTGFILFGIMGFGYSMAGIYPTTVSFTGILIQRYKMAWSFILTAASLGSILMPTIIGRIAEQAGIFYGMSSIAVVLVVDMIAIIVLVRYTTKQGKVEN
ncbi:MAG: MFS transporter [Lachnospiraceae bacterium]|nr:MFS transporter [Lachnospiraceae bacterium]